MITYTSSSNNPWIAALFPNVLVIHSKELPASLSFFFFFFGKLTILRFSLAFLSSSLVFVLLVSKVLPVPDDGHLPDDEMAQLTSGQAARLPGQVLFFRLPCKKERQGDIFFT